MDLSIFLRIAICIRTIYILFVYLKFNFIIISVASLNFINLLCKYNQLIFEFNHFLIFNLINFRLTNEISEFLKHKKFGIKGKENKNYK